MRDLTKSYSYLLNTVLWRNQVPRGVDGRQLRALLASIERIALLIFGASTILLRLIQFSFGFFEDGSGLYASTQTELMESLVAVAVVTTFFAFKEVHHRWNSYFYSVYYIALFLVVYHFGMPESAADVNEKFLTYLAFTLSQALRPGRFSGWPVLLFLLAHILFFQDFEASEALLVQHVFTLIWAALLALFLESVLLFACVRYLELRGKIAKESADLSMAQKVHENLFPSFRENDRLRLDVYRSPENQTGGDFYDLVRLREGDLGLFLADVSGHGISSAMMTAALKVLLARMPYRLRLEPVEMMEHLDETMSRDFGSHHASAVYVMFDFKRMRARLANAGHPAAMYAPQGRPFREIRTQGSVLGYRVARPIAQELAFSLEPGDRFFLYTDGLTEYASSNGSETADIHAEVLLAGLEELDGEALIEAVLERIRNRHDFAGFKDDVMIAVIHVK